MGNNLQKHRTQLKPANYASKTLYGPKSQITPSNRPGCRQVHIHHAHMYSYVPQTSPLICGNDPDPESRIKLLISMEFLQSLTDCLVLNPTLTVCDTNARPLDPVQ